MKFVVYYVDKKRNSVLGAASMGTMNAIQIINEAMRNGTMVTADQVRAKDFKVDDLIPALKESSPKCTRCGNIVP